MARHVTIGLSHVHASTVASAFRFAKSLLLTPQHGGPLRSQHLPKICARPEATRAAEGCSCLRRAFADALPVCVLPHLRHREEQDDLRRDGAAARRHRRCARLQVVANQGGRPRRTPQAAVRDSNHACACSPYRLPPQAFRPCPALIESGGTYTK